MTTSRRNTGRWLLVSAILGAVVLALSYWAGRAPTTADDSPGARARRSRFCWRRVAGLVALVTVAVGLGAGAWAYWSGIATAGANGAAVAASVNAPAPPTAVVGSAQSVAVSWAAGTLTDGQTVTGYTLKRYDATSSLQQTIAAACAGSITTLTCTEAGVPMGQWQYTITPLIGTSWQGTESLKSAQVNVGASVLTLARTNFGAPLPITTTGTLTGFNGNEDIIYRLDEATALTGSPATANGAGAATITALTIPAGTSQGPHTVYAVGASGSLASFNILVDLTAPTVSAVRGPPANGAGWNNSSPVSVTLTGDDLSGSGLNEIRYTTNGVDPTPGNTTVYSAPISVVATQVIKYYGTDLAGNTSVFQTLSVNIDTTAPVNALTLSNVTGNAIKTGDTIYYRGAAAGSFTITNTLTDPGGSGPATSSTATLAGTSTGFSHAPSSVGTPYISATFSWTAGTTTSPTESVTGTDTAGETVTTMLTFVDDSTGPTGGSVAATGLVGTGSLYSTSTTLNLALAKGTDANGVPATGAQLQRATATLTSAGTPDGTCGDFGSYTLITGGTDPTTPKADTVTDQACYRFQYVVPDNLGNTSTFTSGDIKVDTTAPSAATLAFSAPSNTYPIGTAVYYRSGAATGAFTVTAAAADLTSGISGYAFPTLGTNWTSTPGASGVNTYSWSGAPAAPGAKNVTATSNATGTSNSTFTPTADSTAPTGGTVSYANGFTTGRAVSVSFTAGTADTGSGVATSTGRLMRASVALTNGVCGTFPATSDLALNPASPYVDTTVANGTCYVYEYVMADNVGNNATWTNANVAKVDYAAAVNSTTGAVGQWRLGETATVSDTFTDTTGTVVSSHTGEIGAAPWTRWTSDTITGVITASGTLRKSNATGGVTYYSSAGPASANYQVEADVVVKTNLPSTVGVVGRLNTAASAGGTYYLACYDQTAAAWQISKSLNGTTTMVGTAARQTLSAGVTYHLGLDMNGSTIRLLVDGVLRISATDTTITATGRAGVRLGASGESTAQGDTIAYHLDNFQVSPPVADSKGTNDGAYVISPTLGVTGALSGDSNTAARFDGTNDQVSIPDAAALDVDDVFSVEAWVKRTTAGTVQTIMHKGSGSFQWSFDTLNTLGLYTDAGDLIARTTAPQADLNAFHHYVVTKSGSSVVFYVDGVSVAGTAGTSTTLTNTTRPLYLGAKAGTTQFLNGTLDEVALYNTAISAATVLDHYNLGNTDSAGPTGGSVDATGLVGTGARYSTTTTLNIALAKGTDVRSGLAATGAKLRRSTGTLASAGTLDATCTSYSASIQIGADDPTTPVADTVPAAQACYRYEYVVADTLGNATTYLSGDIKIDNTAPTAPTFAYSALTNAYASGGTVYYRPEVAGSFTATATATDINSGIASYAYPSLGTGWTATPGAPGVTTYSWTANPTAPGGPQNVMATNNALLVSPAGSFTMSADSTAPAGGSVDATSLTGTGSRYAASTALTIALSKGTDANSGTKAIGATLSRDVATLSTGTCSGWSGNVALGVADGATQADTIPSTNGKCYRYLYVVLDNVGNSVTYTSGDIKFDTTAPAVPTLAFSALTNATVSGNSVYYQPGVAGSFTVTATTTDADSGILSYAFPSLGTSWTATPVALGVTTYSWTASPAEPGAKTVTATNNASLVSATVGFSAQVGYADAVDATSSLVSHWRLGETSGTTMADSKGTNHGTYVDSPTLGVTGGPTNDTNKAVTFASASSQYASVPDTATLDVGDTFSAEAWVKRTTAGTVQTIMHKGSGSFQWSFDTSNTLGLYTDAGGLIARTTAPQADLNAFHHYVVTKSGSSVVFYVDGVSVAGTAGTSTTLTNTTTPLYLGAKAGTTQFLNGTLDEVALYNTALSAGTVLDHYNRGSTVPNGASLEWNFEELTGTNVDDSSGYNPENDGTASWTTPTPWDASGHTGRAIKFDNNINHYVAGTNQPIDTSQPFTVSAWVNLTSATGVQTVLSQGPETTTAGNDSNFIIKTGVVSSVQRWSAMLKSPTGHTQVDSTSTATTGWIRLTAVYDGATLKLYVGTNAPVSLSHTVQTTGVTTTPLQLGRTMWNGAWVDPLNGKIDQVRTYRRALTATEVATQ